MIQDEQLQRWTRRILAERGDKIDFIVLYGSRARGTHRPYSDYDILVGLAGPSEQRFRDRTEAFEDSDLYIEAKIFSPEELDRLWFQYARTLIDALAEGHPLFDRGGWARRQSAYRATLEAGVLEREGRNWIWHKDREPSDSPRLAEDRRLREAFSLTVRCPGGSSVPQ